MQWEWSHRSSTISEKLVYKQSCKFSTAQPKSTTRSLHSNTRSIHVWSIRICFVGHKRGDPGAGVRYNDERRAERRAERRREAAAREAAAAAEGMDVEELSQQMIDLTSPS